MTDTWTGSWEDAEDFALEASLRATPTQRLAWLEEMRQIAFQSGALQRALDERWEREKAMWEGTTRM